MGLVTCGARHLRVWVVDVSLPKLHPMDAIMGALKRIMISVTIGSGDEFAYVGTTTGEVLKFSIGRDGIQGPNDPDRTRPRYREISRAKCSQGVQRHPRLVWRRLDHFRMVRRARESLPAGDR